jgi:hypothetical protein
MLLCLALVRNSRRNIPEGASLHSVIRYKKKVKSKAIPVTGRGSL